MVFNIESLNGFSISPDGDTMDGIFNYFTKNNLNPFTQYILRISSSSLNAGNQKSLEELIVYNYNSYVQTDSKTDSYIEVLFLSNFRVLLTNYSLVGYRSKQFSKEWEVQGLVSYNNWKTISYQQSGKFCESTNRDCGNNNIVTFPISNPTIVSGFKFISKVGSTGNAHYFLTRGIEIFGTILFSDCLLHNDITSNHNSFKNTFRFFVSILFIYN